MKSIYRFILVMGVCLFSHMAHAGEVGCVSTTWRVVNDDKVCTKSFKDPDIQGVVCEISYAQTGGITGAVGIAENPSRFSLSCTQNGPMLSTRVLPQKEESIFKQSMSAFFKGIKITRMYDSENNVISYLAISEKLINGSPFNSNSTVSIRPWAQDIPKVNFAK